jgi:diamine N-acetyltransferase
MTRVDIRPLADADVEQLVRLAHDIWHAHYPGIISLEQINAMLAERYSPASVRATLHTQHWDVAWVGTPPHQEMAGFAHAYADAAPSTWKLDKLYVHPHQQRKGIGLALLQRAMQHAASAGAIRLILRVNRHNSGALRAYAKYGFRVYAEDVLDIGNGFVMDDFLMELQVCS